MKRKIFKALVLCFMLTISLSSAVIRADAEAKKEFNNVTISILGDSISTFTDYSSGKAAETTNTTIKNNFDYYKPGRFDVNVEDTWWHQAAEKLDAKILVNNSYSNTQIFNSSKYDVSDGYLIRPYNLYDNTGENTGEEPDIIAVYIGTNDFSYGEKRLGNEKDIDYDKLISINCETGISTYAEPKTSAEAYAIMLHKIVTTYENAEVYCFTFLPKEIKDATSRQNYINFNQTIKDIAEHFSCFTVDLFNESGITTSNENINRYLYFGYIHPNKRGMDAITGSFLSSLYKNSKFKPENSTAYNVTYDLKDVIVNEGTQNAVLDTQSFECSLSKLTYGDYDVIIKMGNEDITSRCFKDGKIYIERITDDISITAKIKSSERTFKNYRFENKDGKIVNILQNENSTNLTEKKSDGLYEFSDILLYYDKPWSIVFDTVNCYKSQNKILSSNKDNGVSVILDTVNELIGFSSNSDDTVVFGESIKELSLNYNENHTFRIANSYNLDGSNTYTLYVDRKKIGNFDSTFKNGKKTDNYDFTLTETDLVFNSIGAENDHLNKIKLNYLQIWGDTPNAMHKHKYVYTQTVSPTCVDSGYKSANCDCGDEVHDIIVEPLGHIFDEWIIIKEPTLIEAGAAQRKCIVCNTATEYKYIPPKTCSAPQLKNVTNLPNGVLFTWKPVEGAIKYRIYRRGSGENWKPIKEVTGTSFTDMGVANFSGKYFKYTVRAINGGGLSEFNNGLLIKFVATPKMTGALNTANGIKVSWSKVSGANGYRLYRRGAGQSWQYIGLIKSTSYIDTTVKNKSGSYYKYTVRAVSGERYSSCENGIVVKVVKAPHLKAIKNYANGINITWDRIPGADYYRIYRRSAGGAWYYIKTVSGTAYTDTTIKNNKGAYFKYTVRAVDSGTYSGFENGLLIRR